MDRREHWDEVYTRKAETSVSWYQPHAGMSLSYIKRAATSSTPIVDIGGGASTLVDDLLAEGFTDLTVVDVAGSALAKSRARLGDRAAHVAWVVADVTRWRPPRQYGIWHDRAVFHFLTSREDQQAYIAAMAAHTAPGATAIMATFAPDGPEKCSGLPVQRYSAQELATRVGPAFQLIEEAQETHTTPWNATQKFTYAMLKRTA